MGLFKKITIFTLSAVLLAGCTERIDITTRDAKPHLVIYGCITSDEVYQSVKITRSTGYFATTPPEGVSGAQVILLAEGREYRLFEGGEKGVYLTEFPMAGTEGAQYTLRVALDFLGDGRITHYEASSRMPVRGIVDDVEFRNSETFDNHIKVLLSAHLPETDSNYFNVRLWRNDVRINDSLAQFTLFDDIHLTTSVLVGIPCTMLDQEEPREKLEDGDLITLSLDAITREYSEFLAEARSEASGSIPFFGGPPANLDTNIQKLDAGDKTPLAGFFTAFSSSAKSVVYKKQ